MPDIITTIPPAKVALVKAAIQHHTGDEMTNDEMLAWVQHRFISVLRLVVSKYEDAEHDKNIVRVDPME